MNGFTKLFSEILTSSIWNEDDKTRILWITMLASAGPDGIVRASVGGLAHQARMDKPECVSALEVLKSPDPDSRSKEFEGRRVKEVDGGFLLLNYSKYREARSEDERKIYMAEYMRNYRKQSVNIRKQNVNTVNHSKPPLAKEEAEEEVEVDKKEDVVDFWNSATSLSKCAAVTEKRRSAIKTRMADSFFRENWKTAVEKVKESEFCCGKNDRGWKADIDWFLRPDTVAKIIEGKYDNKDLSQRRKGPNI